MSELVALAGLPNSGKTSLFNTLTGSRQRVANFPGITVERKKGIFSVNNKDIEVIDLPGLYTLDIHSLDEKVARDFLLGKSLEKLSQIILVVDATSLERSLYLALQLKEIGHKFILALNMIDLAEKRGLKLDLEKLAFEFNCKVVPLVAHDKKSVHNLSLEIEKNLSEIKLNITNDYQTQIKKPEYIKEKFLEIDRILKSITVAPLKPDTLTKRIDQVVLHPVWGSVILVLGLITIFQALFSWADPIITLLENGIEAISGFMAASLPEGYFNDFIVNGVIAGVGGFLVFLPHILILFFFILVLEDIGYLGRAAFLLESIMKRFGLPGKAAIPLLSGHACAIPGIMSARIIKDDRDRLATILVTPLTTCSARIPVFTLLIAAMFAHQTTKFGLSVGGLVMFALYALGIFSSFIVAFILKKKTIQGAPTAMLMELPSYKIPRLQNIVRGLWHRAVIFCKKAGTVIFSLSILLWVMTTFPKPPENATEPAINYSMSASVGKFLEPVFRPLGFDWKITTALIPSFGAREVMVASMGTIMAVEGSEGEESFDNSLTEKLQASYSVPTLLALLIWFVYAPQCIATFGVIRRETNSYKWPIFVFLYTLTLAYILSFATYQISRIFI